MMNVGHFCCVQGSVLYKYFPFLLIFNAEGVIYLLNYQLLYNTVYITVLS